MNAHPTKDEQAAAPLTTLLENHRAFLSYLERRVGDRALAEDILHDAFIKLVERPEQAPLDDGVVPWFYRTLRNAAIDRFRRRGTADRAMKAFAREIEAHQAPTPDVETEICACVMRLASTLNQSTRKRSVRSTSRGRPSRHLPKASNCPRAMPASGSSGHARR